MNLWFMPLKLGVTRILSLCSFADALLERKVGVCNYAKYKLINARV